VKISEVMQREQLSTGGGSGTAITNSLSLELTLSPLGGTPEVLTWFHNEAPEADLLIWAISSIKQDWPGSSLLRFQMMF
jgi:hypothetical protein